MTPIKGLAKKTGSSPTAVLERLNALVTDDLAGVNNVILERMQSSVALIPQLASYVIAAGGKRLRPILTLVSARLCGYHGRDHIALAACVEFIHTATLLHDDVVDTSDLRRGLASANAVWGNKTSVLVGDFLFSRAFQLMVEQGSLAVLRILSHASSVIAEGEVMQLAAANDTDTGEEEYMAVIRAKTATLFAAACRIGAVVAGRPEAEERALERYGLNLGIAFQLADDVLDYSAVEKTLGKAVGDDFRDGKITLPVVLAFARGDEAERAFWRRTLEAQELREDDLAHALELLQRRETLTDTLSRAREYGGAAREALGAFPETPERAALLDLIDFTVERAF